MKEISLGHVLWKERTKRGWTVEDVACRVGLSKGQISKIEQDKSVPSDETLGRFGHTFRISFEYLLFRTGRLPADIARLPLEPQDIAAVYKTLRGSHGPEAY